MKNFIKRLLDGGLAEDIHSFMERVLDEDSDKEKIANLKFEEYLEDCAEAGKNIKAIREDERKRFLKKAKEWLKHNMKVKTTSYADLWDNSETVQVVSDFYTIDEMINSFCKSMEE